MRPRPGVRPILQWRLNAATIFCEFQLCYNDLPAGLLVGICQRSEMHVQVQIETCKCSEQLKSSCQLWMDRKKVVWKCVIALANRTCKTEAKVCMAKNWRNSGRKVFSRAIQSQAHKWRWKYKAIRCFSIWTIRLVFEKTYQKLKSLSPHEDIRGR